MPTVTLGLAKMPIGPEIPLTLELDDSRLATAVISALGTVQAAIQVRWSGEAFFIPFRKDFPMPEDIGELEQRHELGRGMVAFNRDLLELLVAYGDHVKVYEPGTGALNCYIIGKVAESDHEKLADVGNSIWRQGERWAMIG